MINDKNKEKLDKILNEKNFADVKYSIKVVDDMRVDRISGKYKLIIRK